MDWWSVAVIPTNECSKNNIAGRSKIVADSAQTVAVGFALGAVLVPITDGRNAICLQHRAAAVWGVDVVLRLRYRSWQIHFCSAAKLLAVTSRSTIWPQFVKYGMVHLECRAADFSG